MTPELRNSTAHVFVANIDSPVLSDTDAHHLTRVLRIKSGETITICDGAGLWRTATINGGAVEPISVVCRAESPRESRIAFVPVKGDRTELIVQKATEIGVSEIVVIAPTARSVVKWDDRKSRSEIDRLSRIAREASMQSRRLFLPRVVGPVALADVAAMGFAVAEPGGAVNTMPGAIAVGPEGGFAPNEVALFSTSVDLGDTILRAETAAIVAAVRVVSTATMRG